MDSTEISELKTLLKKAQSRERILDAKLRNQVARYERLQDSMEDSSDALLEREKRQKNHLLRQVQELEADLMAARDESRELRPQMQAKQDELDEFRLQAAESQHNLKALRESMRTMEAIHNAQVDQLKKQHAAELQQASDNLRTLEREFVDYKKVKENTIAIRSSGNDGHEVEKLKLEIDYLKAELFEQRQKLLKSYLNQAS